MSRTQREALVIIIDVGANTTALSGKSGKTFFERAKECAKKIILRRILTKPEDEIGVILFGTGETKNDLNSSDLGFENIVEMDFLQCGTWKLVKALDNVKPGNATCDWIDALLVGINYIKNETGAKNFCKTRIILITNFQVEAHDDELNVVAANISDNMIELIGVSDTVQYENSNTNLTSCQFTQNPNKEEAQSKSEKIFQELIDQIEDANLCHIDYVESQLALFQKKTTRAMPWNATLSIGSQLLIEISAFVYIQDEKFFGSFKTECLDQFTATRMVTEYYRNNETIEKPDEDDVVKAYMYGSKFIAIDDQDLAYKGGKKCLACLAFCKRDKIPQEYFIGDGCHIVVPQKDSERSETLFSLLVQAMAVRNYLMLARKVYRDDIKPQIVALIPQIEDETNYLMMYELPYYEDVEFFSFPTLDQISTKPTDQQMEAMNELVELMDLTDAIDDETGITEAFTQDTMQNPYHQNVCKSVAYRALNPTEPLPPIDKDLLKLIDTPEKIKQRIESFIIQFEDFFPREIIQRKDRKKPLGQLQKDGDTAIDDTEIYDHLSSERTIVAIGTVTPAEDFLYLLKKGERFSVLCEQMQSIIYEYIFKSMTKFEDMADKIKETILAFREAATIHAPLNYNKWIAELKAMMTKRNKIDEWNLLIVKEGLGLISQNESPMSTIALDEQVAFYEIISKNSSRNFTSIALEEEDDLAALL
ncbi:hypothetical protein PVAND_009374 [Polypedilum vanderplanki]|uniref:Ku domain-containing protein n=1 Tax=Polypedilum vanderplanki TaxID=319348 RepID=A0A9J6CCJ4_POLVA|nr:hypothetical protein PVAND_009374 [Polypedilum vanderplanki]